MADGDLGGFIISGFDVDQLMMLQLALEYFLNYDMMMFILFDLLAYPLGGVLRDLVVIKLDDAPDPVDVLGVDDDVVPDLVDVLGDHVDVVVSAPDLVDVLGVDDVMLLMPRSCRCAWSEIVVDVVGVA